MKRFAGIITTILLGLGISTGYSQDHSQHQGATDHSQHPAGAATDHMAHLDADLEEIRKTTDSSKRKQMLQHHLQMMRENMQALTAMDHGMGGMQGMDHGNKGEGASGMQGMDHAGMMQHHDKMTKVLQHMLETQELILGLIDK